MTAGGGMAERKGTDLAQVDAVEVAETYTWGQTDDLVTCVHHLESLCQVSCAFCVNSLGLGPGFVY
jgi:hypothetical protein